MEFDVSQFGSKIVSLLGCGDRIMSLGPGIANEPFQHLLARFDPLRDLGKPVTDRAMAVACHSALWLYHDFLDESHTISQDLDTETGSFLHAIMHRREPDAWNSKYWWRRANRHPVLERLIPAANRLGWSSWDPNRFVDACEQERGSGSDRETLLQQVQLTEWQVLFAYCWQAA